MTILHIEPGWYSLRHDKDSKVEVGQAIVLAAASGTLEHWYLYQSGGSGYAAYTQPSAKNPDVTVYFKYLGTPPPSFDPSLPRNYARSLPAGVEPHYILADCTSDPTKTALEQSPSWFPQIDWGKYRLFQGSEVGSVSIDPYGTQPLETWTLATGASGYVPPGKAGGSYRLVFLPIGTPAVPASPEYVYALCSGM